jgi:hypothetical protein
MPLSPSTAGAPAGAPVEGGSSPPGAAGGAGVSDSGSSVVVVATVVGIGVGKSVGADGRGVGIGVGQAGTSHVELSDSSGHAAPPNMGVRYTWRTRCLKISSPHEPEQPLQADHSVTRHGSGHGGTLHSEKSLRTLAHGVPSPAAGVTMRSLRSRSAKWHVAEHALHEPHDDTQSWHGLALAVEHALDASSMHASNSTKSLMICENVCT